MAEFWYKKVLDKTPRTGRLYYEFKLLIQPYTLEQLFLYIRPLAYLVPLESAGVQYRRTHPSLPPRFEEALDPQEPCDVCIPEQNETIQAWGKATSEDFYHFRSFCLCLRIFLETMGDYTCIPCIRLGATEKGLAWMIATLDPILAGLLLKRIVSIFSPSKLSFSLFILTASGSPPKREKADVSVDTALPQPPSSFDGWPHIIFVAVVLPTAQFLAGKKGPIPVWGSMMAVWAFAWWGIREDVATSLWLMGT